jgi:hypothetical protein
MASGRGGVRAIALQNASRGPVDIGVLAQAFALQLRGRNA